MQIDLQSRSFELTDSLDQYVRRRLGFSMAAWQDRIQRMVIRLTDINGPRGGDDKCCQIHLIMDQVNDIVIEDTQADLYVAIDRASSRAARTLSRRLNRMRDRQRKRDNVMQNNLDSAYNESL